MFYSCTRTLFKRHCLKLVKMYVKISKSQAEEKIDGLRLTIIFINDYSANYFPYELIHQPNTWDLLKFTVFA